MLDGQPTLRGWLAGRGAAERQTLARLWGITPVNGTADELATRMLQPATIETVIAALSPGARSALARVQHHGGRIKAVWLEREFGKVRPHAGYPDPRAYLLALATPPSAVEQLVVYGLLLEDREEIPARYHIPADLMRLLAIPAAPDGLAALTAQNAPERALIADVRALEERALLMLQLAYDGALATGARGALTRQALRMLDRAWGSRPDPRHVNNEHHWPYARFLRSIMLAAGLLRYDTIGLLRPTAQAVTWLRMTRLERLRHLLDAWIDTQWDELSDLLGIVARNPERRNLPATRRAVLALLARLPAGVWLAQRDLAAAVKLDEPDFARPDGDYDAWRLRRGDGGSLDGFAHWDQVEGQQLATMIGVSLRWLGLCDADSDETSYFRISVYGAVLLHNGPPPEEPPAAPIALLPNFEIIMPPDASLEARFQIGRIASAARTGAPVYQLTRRSILAALDRGIGIEEILRFFREQSGAEPPQNVAVTLREWAGRHGRVRLRRAAVLDSDEPLLLEQIRRDPRVRLPPVEPLSATTWLLADADAPLLAERLRRAGYAPAADDAPEPTPLRDSDLAAIATALEFYQTAGRHLGLDMPANSGLTRRVARMLGAAQRRQAREQAAAALERFHAATIGSPAPRHQGDE